MPARQDTFRLVPTTLVNKAAPRPPMTSKAAKKAYREANRLPKISRAEQRRIEAAEIARQKKEYEKEKAAAKAKTAREKKLKKEAEERAKRKELGLPEPSRFVRPSQPTIKVFVKSARGQKRLWEEVHSKDEDEVGAVGDDDNHDGHSEEPTGAPAKRVVLKQIDDDDEFGDFPSLSQADLPTLFAEPSDTSRTLSIETSSSRSQPVPPKSQSVKCGMTSRILTAGQIRLDADMAESHSSIEATLATTTAPAPRQYQSSTASLKVVSSSREMMRDPSEQSSTIATKRHLQTMTTPTVQKKELRKSAGESSRTLLPLAVPLTVNRMRLRTPLNEISRNMAPPPRPPRVQAVTSTRMVNKKSERRSGRENWHAPPPSTLAFLEAHMDDFFPSPSQQVRELLEEIDDMPSNTQIAREIDLNKQESIPVRTQQLPSPPLQSQIQIDDEALHFLSSQDLEISSQDLREIDTPSKAKPKGSFSRDLNTRILALTEDKPKPPPTPKLKPRFFEEKEDDLLYAALHESLLLSRQTTQSSSPRRSERVLRRTQSVKTDHSYNDYGSDGSDLDAELLALLDDA